MSIGLNAWKLHRSLQQTWTQIQHLNLEVSFILTWSMVNDSIRNVSLRFMLIKYNADHRQLDILTEYCDSVSCRLGLKFICIIKFKPLLWWSSFFLCIQFRILQSFLYSMKDLRFERKKLGRVDFFNCHFLKERWWSEVKLEGLCIHANTDFSARFYNAISRRFNKR